MSTAPGVVAAVVVHWPAPDLPAVLTALACQDYPNMQVLVLLTGSSSEELSEVQAIASEIVPLAHVRNVGENSSFGRAASTVLRLVEGDSGFFLLLHDDVALAPDAVRLLVEELYRSNAGIVGPKFLEWEDERKLRTVGFDCDWFGELDSAVEPHEIDQEQHDAVRDVFVVSSAGLLVRADLFRELNGFDDGLEYFGEDLDLCWRAHLSGARVIVVPAATARERGDWVERSSRGLDSVSLHRTAERNRTTTVLALTGARRLFLMVPALLVLTLFESVSALIRGRWQRAAGGVRLWAGVAARLASVIRRRRRVRSLRRVPDHEVVELQSRGSARWKRALRHRRVAPVLALTSVNNSSSTRSSEVRRSPLTLVVWGVLAILLLVGGRQLWANGVRSIGELLPLPGSTRNLFREYASGWWAQDLGSSSAQPTSVVLVALGGIFTLGNSGLLHTLITIGLIPLGWLGASALCSVVATERARLVGVIAYAAVPLPYAAVATGRHQVLVAYAVIPWALHLIRSFGGIGTSIVDDTPGDVIDHPTSKQRVRLAAKLALLFGVTMAFSPAVVVVVLLSAVLWLIAAAIAGGSMRAAGLGVAGVIAAGAGAVVLNLPWITRFLGNDGWTAIVGAPTANPENASWWKLLRFDIGPTALGGLAIFLFVPLLVAPLVSKNSRFIWASRAAVLSIGGVVVAALGSGDHLPFRLPETGILLAPVACGLAIGASIIVMSFGIDVRGGRFGWRQPLTLLSLITLPLGLIPVVASAPNGQWQQPSATLAQQMSELLGDENSGDFRVLMLGDPRLVTSDQHVFAPGLAWALLPNSRLTMLNQFSSSSADSENLVRPLIAAIADGTTERVGRLLAPLGVRYVVVPLLDRVRSTSDAPFAVPRGLLDSLGEQLDLRHVYGPASMAIFENSQWVPVTSMLSPMAAEQSGEGGAAALVATDLSGSLAALGGTSAWSSPSRQLPAGRFHVGVPFDDRWMLVVDGTEIAPDASFGTVMSFDTGDGGTARLTYVNSKSRLGWIIAQLLAWLAVMFAVLQPRIVQRRISRGSNPDGLTPIVSLAGSQE